MTERLKVIEAGGKPARDRDGIFRHRGVWHFKACVNGRWRQFSTGTRNWQAARAKRRTMLADIEAGKLPGDMARWPLPKAIDAWLAGRVHCTAANTQSLERNVSKALVREFPARTLADVTPDGIRSYQAARTGKVAPRTVNAETKVLRGVLKMAKLWGRIADDYKPLKEPPTNRRALTPQEESALFRAAASRPEWHVAHLCAVVAVNTAARKGEIRQLQLGDLDLPRAMTIRRSITKTDSGARTVPLNHSAAWALARLIERAQALGASQPDHFLLPLALHRLTTGGQPCAGTGYDPARPMRGWRSAWRKLVKAAGLPALPFHSLRHHAVTKLIEAGVPAGVVATISGHSSQAMVAYYTHARAESRIAAVNAINIGAPPDAALADAAAQGPVQ